jgi:hypothetical protein
MTTNYYQGTTDRETVLYKHVGGLHDPWGICPHYLPVGIPGLDKADHIYRPLFHITGFPGGKTGADVVSAKLWLYVWQIIGTPHSWTHYIKRCERYNWYEWDYDDPDYHTLYCDATCYQHSGGAWTTYGGDFSVYDMTAFEGPEATGWTELDITLLVRDALDYRSGDLNIGIIPDYEAASTAWYIYCKHGASAYYPYVEVEWAAGAGVPAALAAAAQIF